MQRDEQAREVGLVDTELDHRAVDGRRAVLPTRGRRGLEPLDDALLVEFGWSIRWSVR